ncbi:polyphenol oxidase [Azospirillum sp. TSH100]|uniref:peptidoglycan editing factor PgeF n=1 Tax=Azospirillum sp. TSH100 TaxID=652764 RepID=UPI000D61DB61|nr:peptidoglycan editing factor PgeF [Azospirillum sp. TSH100]PWC81213.1 polyphenol oxidase [Azospirillum sp. TSH100]QCG86445.1 peptidoglycan editing factor PgeF [Azospirillum sp. TSH100]
MITLGALNDITHIRHAFFTRTGGVSTGLYASLNCGLGSSDSAAAVHENRARAAARMEVAPGNLITCHQVHSPTCVVVEEPWTPETAPKADAMATRQPGIALGILTADCAPVLFADSKARVIGAAHAGWKGAKGGVIEATVARMVELGAKPNRIVACIGPCIAQRSYEVGPEFPTPFEEEDARNRDYFAPARKPGHFLFDLAAYVTRRLGDSGVTVIQRCPNDTVAEEDRFFSYRRSCLRGEPDYGRGLSAIVLQN